MVIVTPTSDRFWAVPGIRAVCGTVNATVAPATEWRLEAQATAPIGVGQVKVQSAPKLAGSPATVAPKFRTAPAGAEAGKGEVMTMLVTVEVMVTVAAEDLLRSVVDNAVTATVFFLGTPGGA